MTPTERPAHLVAANQPVANAPDVVVDLVDETSLDSFPASDPPSWTGMQAGRPDRSSFTHRREAAGPPP